MQGQVRCRPRRPFHVPPVVDLRTTHKLAVTQPCSALPVSTTGASIMLTLVDALRTS